MGCVTGMDLAQMNRAYLHRWLNLALYFMAEAAIICTDIGQVCFFDDLPMTVIYYKNRAASLTTSQVIGTAIALNILNPKIPLIAGCVISVTDTLFILAFYRPDGSIRKLRMFEVFVSVFVIGVFIMFCIELSLIAAPAAEVFKGFLPSRTVFVGQG